MKSPEPFVFLADDDLDDAMDVTIIMTKEELDAILEVDSSHGERSTVHERPTVVSMPTVKVA